jgi:hypothetical protein
MSGRRTSKRLRAGDDVETIKEEEAPSVIQKVEPKEEPLDESVSDYERMRIENMRRNADFLSTIGLDAVKPVMAEPVEKKKATASRRGVSAPIKKEPTVMRRSSRVTIERLKTEIEQNKDSGVVDDEKEKLLAEMVDKKNAEKFESYVEVEAENWRPDRLTREDLSMIPPSNTPTSEDDWGRPIIDTLRELSLSESEGKKGKRTAPMSSYVPPASEKVYIATLKALRCKEEDVAKVAESRITAMWMHTSSEKILCAAGDKEGYVGIWDVDNQQVGKDGVFRYRPHVSNINKLHNYASDPCKLWTSSYDGTIRYLDFEKESFVLGWESPDSMYDVFYSDVHFSDDEHTCFIGRSDGKMSLVDFRVPIPKEGVDCSYTWSHSCHPVKLNSLQQHPTQPHIIVSAGSGKDGTICVHDLRKVGKSWNPLNELNNHTKSINAANVSPDGRFLISVSQDNTLRTWANFISKSDNTVCSVTHHDNHTGRWLSTFRPAFDPKQGHVMVLGSMHRPRQIEVFSPQSTQVAGNKSKKASPSPKAVSDAGEESNVSLTCLATLKDDYLASVCSRNCFHPSLDIIAGGNSSGRVHILR